MDLLRWTLAFIGHIGLWCVIFNFIHSTALPRLFRKRTEKLIVAAVALPLLFFLAAMIIKRTASFDALSQSLLASLFLYSCIVLGVVFFVQWLYRKLTSKLPAAVIETKTDWLNLKRELNQDLLHGPIARSIGKLPFNECLKLTLNRMTFQLDVPEKLDGLKICHLSDLHFTGQIGVEYFERLVSEANQFEPDLVFITGDLVDEADCLPWLEKTLGALRAKHGVYYVLGNHDTRIKDESTYRSQLAGLGLIQASGQWHSIVIDGVKIQLTGNELPWYRDADKAGNAPDEKFDLRVLLSHSPDQLNWALERKFDLMFAGHTHGGQIAFPFIGPIVAPSKYGVRYAAGTFQVKDMIMHVSRGISGDEPIRFCCPPELGLFTIRSSRLKKDTDNSTDSTPESAGV